MLKLVQPGWGVAGREATVLARTSAEPDGRYRLVGAGNRHCLVCAVHPDAASALVPVQPKTGPVLGQIPGSPHRALHLDVQLERGVPFAGQVVSSTGAPVPRARVAVGLRSDAFTASTDTITSADGSFQFEHMVAGASYIAAGAPGFVDALETATLPLRDYRIVLSSGGAMLGGVVREKPSGEPRSGITVTINPVDSASLPVDLRQPPSVVTDAAGAFQFSHLPAGSRSIDARNSQHRLVPSRKNEYRVQLRDGQTSDNLQLWVYAGHTLHGTVTEKYTTSPVEGAKIFAGSILDPASSSTLTNADGSFRLENVFPSDGENYVSLRAEKDGYKLIAERSQGGLTIKLNPQVADVEQDLEMVKAVHVSGMVKLPNGQPATMAVVESLMPDYGGVEESTAADASGHYSLSVRPNSNLMIRASAADYPTTLSAVIKTRDEGVENLDLVLNRPVMVRGIVQDGDGAPVAGASVRCQISLQPGETKYGEETVKDVSDADGHFHFDNLPALPVQIDASLDGYADTEKVVFTPKGGETTSSLILVLDNACHLAGRITDTKGNSLSKIQVSATSSNRTSEKQTAQSGADGMYRIEGLPPGAVHVVLEDIQVTSGSSDLRTTSCRDDADFHLDILPKTTLTGKVVDWQTSQPVAQFEVTCNTDANVEKDEAKPGEFVIREVTPGTCYSFTISSAGYAPLHKDQVCVPKDKDGKPIEEVFRMGPGGQIGGRVVRKANGSPVAGVKVSLAPQQDGDVIQRTVTQEDGRFLLDGVSPGEQRVIAVKPAAPYIAAEKRIDVKQGVPADAGDIEVYAGTLLRGRVIRIPGETGIPGTAVETTKADIEISVKTDAEGAFQINGLPAGQIELKCPAFGEDEGAGTNVQIGETEEQDVVIRIGSASMKGRVTHGGNPQEGAVMVMNLGSWYMRVGKTDHEGNYQIDYLLPGSQMAIAQPNGGDGREGRAIPVTIPETGTLEKNFELGAAQITGLLMDSSHKPVEGATIIARKPNGLGIEEMDNAARKTVASQADGKFHIDDLEDGVYSVSAEKAEVGRALLAGIEVPPNGSITLPPIELKSTGGTLISVALDYVTGKPLQEASCRITSADGVVLDSEAKRDEHGVQTFTGIVPGRYTVKVTASRYSEAVHQVDIVEGQTSRIEDVLIEAVELVITVGNSGGSTIIGAQCTLAPADANSMEPVRNGSTGVLGVWEAGRVAPGKYEIIVRAGDKKITKQLQIGSGRSEHLESVTLP